MDWRPWAYSGPSGPILMFLVPIMTFLGMPCWFKHFSSTSDDIKAFEWDFKLPNHPNGAVGPFLPPAHFAPFRHTLPPPVLCEFRNLSWSTFYKYKIRFGLYTSVRRNAISSRFFRHEILAWFLSQKFRQVFLCRNFVPKVLAWCLYFGSEFRHGISAWNSMPKVLASFSLPKFWAKVLAPCQNFRQEMIFRHSDE